MATTNSISGIDSRQTPDPRKRSVADERAKSSLKEQKDPQQPQAESIEYVEPSPEEVEGMLETLNLILDSESIQFRRVLSTVDATANVELLEIDSAENLLTLSVREAYQISISCINQDELLAALSGKSLSRLV